MRQSNLKRISLAIPYVVGLATLSMTLTWGIPGFFTGCVLLTAWMIGAVLAFNKAEDKRRKKAAEVEELRNACQNLLYRAVKTMCLCDDMRQDYTDRLATSFTVLPDDLKNWFIATRSACATGSGHPPVINPGDLVSWSRTVDSCLHYDIELVKSAYGFRHSLAIKTIQVALEQAHVLEASRDAELKETRQACRHVRVELAKHLIFGCADIFNRPGPFGANLKKHGGPASLRDVVEANLESIMSGDKPWRDDLLKFVFVPKQQNANPAANV
ncbi:hypothetical protein KJ910_04730 [Patescibacteria group bacterium]|nr:hypothetical protein [Patescibacteria group bacterium]MBU1906723.1 hypothetical protein [Patescibacteria group bacterium]